METVRVELDGQDELVFEAKADGKFRISVIGCSHLMEKVKTLRSKNGTDPRKWEVPNGDHHSDLLLREFILRCQGKWQFPYAHDEVCHCRMISTKIVDQAIIRGAHTPEAVSLQTSASTACGTCRPEVYKIINYRLNRSA
ncbi:MAG: (2Fe-2S)-binding protein [Bdellovibrionota bacterium]